MSRVQRVDNVGIHLIRRGPQRPYGTCLRCQQLKPIYWTSRVDFLCSTCLKKSGLHQFIPSVGARNQDLLDRTPHTKRPLRAQPLRQQPSRSMKPIALQQQKKHQPPQQSPMNAKTMKDEHYIPPDPEVQALWDQRRAAVERRTEQLQREQERKALEQRLAQDPRPFLERLAEYRRYR
jgi:hypothetical protein